MRAPDGVITIFDAPGSINTIPYGINSQGAIAGTYYDPRLLAHGFVRTPDGIITTIDVPGAINSFLFSTNSQGVAGTYFKASGGLDHGFIQARVDAPGALGTVPLSINSAGATTGTYFNATGDHGFVRLRDGTITSFDAPGPETFPMSINSAQAITGYYVADYASHGFVRARDGTGGTPLERLLVERVVACWLNLYYIDALYARRMNDLTWAESDYFQRRQERANRQYLQAIRTLAQVRRLLLPAVQVNIGAQQVNVANASKCEQR